VISTHEISPRIRGRNLSPLTSHRARRRRRRIIVGPGGFIADPEHCLDINECEDQRCHPSAECINLHGSYRCTCPRGTAGDPLGSGCVLPHQCTTHSDCPDTQACVQHNCSNLCSLVDCGFNTICRVLNHAAGCQCQPDYIGDASRYFKVECLSNSDCPTDKYCNQETNKCSSKLLDKRIIQISRDV
jgi:hypothetical protein